ncbi:hypothetical protein [Hippea alviniae]|uniref:hypothetical protein n=1 Tax=Hippea alviniae TaxID=1279027 RepID=UPI0003B6D263|nr:hypothetical protein [Hippea alviniae]
MLYNFLILLVVFALASCSGQGVKYPAPSALRTHKTKPIYKQTEKPKPKPVVKESEFKSVSEAIRFYSLKGDINSQICLAVYYLKAGKIYKARSIVSSLEKKSLSFKEYAKVYAIAGLIRFKEKKGSKDYFELAYAYDEKNSVAKYMLSSKSKSLSVALKKAEKWCKR